MARCNCSSRTCACVIEAGPNIAIAGAGSASNPWVISGTAGGSGSGPPTGAMVVWPGVTPPTGWLLCDGSNVDRTTYAALFAVIGTQYGAGNGTTTFGLPAIPGRVIVGVDSTHLLAATGGALTQTLAAAQLPQHLHDMQHTHAIDHNHPAFSTAAGGGVHNHHVAAGAATTTDAGQHQHAFARGTALDGADVRSGSGGSIGDKNTQPAGTHSHNVGAHDTQNASHQHSIDIPALTGVTSGASSKANTGNTPASATPTAVPIEQPWIGLNWIIKT